MTTFTRLFTTLLCCLFSQMLFSQGILLTFQKCDSLFICGTDTFFVSIRNTGNTPITDGVLQVTLPSGTEYIPGTVLGATEQNVSNPAEPNFSLSSLAPGAVATVALQIGANCAAADALDAGQLFVAGLKVNSSVASAQLNTSSFTIETGLLLIESVTDALMSGEKGDTLLRTICVKNTRLGKIGALYIEDEHLPGIVLEVPGSVTQMNTPTLFQCSFDGSFISAFGDGDVWLELGEKACFTEKVAITSCGIPEFTNPSLLRTGWGCGGTICRYDSILVAIEIKESTRVPDLVFSPVWNPPVDYCGNIPSKTGLKIENAGLADATDVFVKIKLTDTLDHYGIGTGSFSIQYGGNTIPVLPSLSQGGTLNGCGSQVYSEASIIIPKIALQDSLYLFFDTYTCQTPCSQVFPVYSVEYFYRKPCPVNGFVSDTLFISPDGAYLVAAFTGTEVGNCLQDGQSYSFNYQVFSKRLIENNGFLHLRFDMPSGLSPDDSCALLLGGISPDLQQIEPQADGGYSLHLAWELPLPNDSLDLDLCLKYTCSDDIGCEGDIDPPNGGMVIYSSDCPVSCFLQLSTKTYWTPELNTAYECAIGDCDSLRVAVSKSCFSDPGGNTDTLGTIDFIFPLPGFKKWFDVYRLNYGLQDSNDDRQADSALPAVGAGVRRDRFLAGDTLRVEYGGVVDSGGMLVEFGRSIWHEIVGSDMGGPQNNDFFLTQSAETTFSNSSQFKFLQDSLHIRYADGTEYGCLLDDLTYKDDKNFFSINQVNTWPPQKIDDLSSQKFRFYFSLENLFQAGCLPKGTLDFGDSLVVYTDFKIDLNFRPSSGNSPDPPLVGFRTALSAGGKLYAYQEQPYRKLQYSGFRTSRSANTFSIKACENSLEPKKFHYALRIARENMFPYEVRPLARISDYRQTVPGGLTAASARLEYLVLQDSLPWLSNLDLPFSQSPDYLHIDFQPAFAMPVDEGFMLRSNISFLPDCHFAFPDSSVQYITTQFYGCLNGSNQTKKDSVVNQIGFFSNVPGLDFQTSDSVVNMTTSNFDLEFSLNNTTVPQAINTWVTLVSPGGQSSDFTLSFLPQNQPIPAQNGVYNTGTIGSFNQKKFRLAGKNTSCESDTLLIVFGWNCTPLSTPEEASCGRDTYPVILRLQKPELELEVLQEPAAIAICDTSGYFEFEIFNAKTGFAYEPFATVKLPPGLSIVEGSCEIAYPVGSAFIPLDDPENLAGNLYQWHIAGILPDIAANGLPGVDQDPLHAFRIRFRTTAGCGFVANTQLIYGTRGTEPCGRPTNVLNKPGKPLAINGLNPAYGVISALNPLSALPAYCGGSQVLVASVTLLGSPSAGDSIYLLLPAGVAYVQGSYLPVQNGPAGPPTQEGNTLRLALPAGAAPGTAIEFQFTVAFDNEAGCIDLSLVMQTRVRTEAFCQTTGMPCAVYAATGEAILILDPLHPELTLSGTDIVVTGDQAAVTVFVNNTGSVPANGVSVQIWQDTNNDGVAGPADILLQTQTGATILAPGDSIGLAVGQNIDAGVLCDLLIILPAADNCVCADVWLAPDQFTVLHDAQEYCELQTVPVGTMEMPGFTYQWITANGVDCIGCASTTYTPPSGTQPGQTITLILEESSPGCTVQHRFELLFGTPPVAINPVQNTICKGEEIVLLAAPAGQTYFWSGPGVVMPDLAQQILTPASGTAYNLTVTFANGCTGTAATFVTVNLPDTVQLPALTTCQGEKIDVLGTMTDLPGVYSISLKNSAGCDSLVFQVLQVLPSPGTNESRSFCTGDTLAVFDTLLTEGGQICRTFTAENGCDSIHCITAIALPLPQVSDGDTIFSVPGQSVALDGPAGFENYVWFPADSSCLNCPGIIVFPDTGYTEYQLTVTDDNGCDGLITYRIIVLPPCDPFRLNIPNAFTPNGDGVNDVFRVVPFEGVEAIGGLAIYDRWGEKVYEGYGDVFWDGQIKGKPGPSDVYVYRIDVLCDGETQSIWGDVALLR